MIRHIVMWKLKEENKAENALLLKEKLENLIGLIPEIKELEVGININTDSGCCDAVLNSVFISLSDLEKYQKNPLHKEVSEFCKNIRLDRTVVDYSF